MKSTSKLYLKSLSTSIILLMLLMSLAMVPMVSEVTQAEINSTGTYFWVDPSTNIFKSTCNKFNVTIRIRNAPETYAWEATLKFNNYTLGVMRIFEGPWLSANGTKDTMFFTTSLVAANKTGTLSFGCTLLGTVVSGATGDGILCIIEFHVETCGASPLDLQDTALLDMKLVRTNYPNNDGFFACTMVHDIEISSVTASASQVNQGTSVTVTVTVYNGGNYTESGNVKVTARPRDDREPVVQIDVVKSFTDLAQGGSTPLIFTWNTTSVAGEVYDIVSNATITTDDDPHDNVYIGPVVRVVCPHDIDVTDVKLLRPKVHVRQTVYVNVTVLNEGANTESFNVEVWADGTKVAEVSVEDLAPDRSKTVTASWVPTTADEYSLSAVVPGVTDEKDTLDNSKPDGTLTVIYDDVAAIGAKLYPPCGYRIEITIKNNGTEMARFMVYVWADPTPENYPSGDELLIGLVVGGALAPCVNYTFVGLAPYAGIPYGQTWYTLAPPYTPLTPCGTYGIWIVVVKMYDTDDNAANNILNAGTVKARSPGDVNGDGKVNPADLGPISAAWLSQSPQPAYNLQCDFNYDGKVNPADLGPISANWLRTC